MSDDDILYRAMRASATVVPCAECERLRAELTAARDAAFTQGIARAEAERQCDALRALLAEARAALPDMNYTRALVARIDAALWEGEK